MELFAKSRKSRVSDIVVRELLRAVPNANEERAEYIARQLQVNVKQIRSILLMSRDHMMLSRVRLYTAARSRATIDDRGSL